MTSPLDEKGPRPMNYIEQAITDFWGERCDPTDHDCPTCQAWAEYARLSAVALPDELEVVAWECTDLIMGGEHGVITDVDHAAMRKLQPNAWSVEELVRRSQAHSTIAALRAERDEALLCQQEIAAGSDKSATVARIIIAKNEAEARAEAAEARIKALEEALGNMRCPRPCNHRPDEFDAKDCVAAGECGCGAAILSGDLNAPS